MIYLIILQFWKVCNFFEFWKKMKLATLTKALGSSNAKKYTVWFRPRFKKDGKNKNWNSNLDRSLSGHNCHRSHFRSFGIRYNPFHTKCLIEKMLYETPCLEIITNDLRKDIDILLFQGGDVATTLGTTTTTTKKAATTEAV